MKKRLKLKDWVKDLAFGVYFGFAFCIFLLKFLNL